MSHTCSVISLELITSQFSLHVSVVYPQLWGRPSLSPGQTYMLTYCAHGFTEDIPPSFLCVGQNRIPSGLTSDCPQWLPSPSFWEFLPSPLCWGGTYFPSSPHFFCLPSKFDGTHPPVVYQEMCVNGRYNFWGLMSHNVFIECHTWSITCSVLNWKYFSIMNLKPCSTFFLLLLPFSW